MVKRTLERNMFRQAIRHIDLSSVSAEQSFKLIRHVRRIDPDMGRRLDDKLRSLKFEIIMNQVRKKDDPTLGQVIEKVCCRHFLSRFRFVGNIRYDDKIPDSAGSKTIFMEKYSYTRSATDLTCIADRLSGGEGPGSQLISTL